MNNFNKLLEELKMLNLPSEEYAVYGSGPLAVKEIRSTDDLDVLVTDRLFTELKRLYPNNVDGDKLVFDRIDIYPSWNWMWGGDVGDLKDEIARAEIISGVKFMTLKDLAICKKKMGRQKNLDDVKLIEEYLNNSPC